MVKFGPIVPTLIGGEKPIISSHDAAKESNLPSVGSPRPASFEDRMGHQARAAPGGMLGRAVP